MPADAASVEADALAAEEGRTLPPARPTGADGSPALAGTPPPTAAGQDLVPGSAEPGPGPSGRDDVTAPASGLAAPDQSGADRPMAGDAAPGDAALGHAAPGPASPEPAMQAQAAAPPALRILQADAVSVAAERWEHGLAGAAGLGFGHVLLAPVFAPGPRGERSVIADLARLHPALGDEPAEAWLRRASAAAGAHGLGLLLDLRLDRVASGSTLAGAQQGLFAPPDEDALLDPRRDVDVNASRARLDAPGRAEALGAWWGQHLAAWHALGVAGFRLLGLADLPGDAVAPLLRALRRGCPGALLLAWTPGLPWPVLEGLAGLGLDGVFCSLPWWDGEGAWLWEEIARLRGVAPVLAPTAAPDGEAVVPHEPAQRAAAGRRLALAALAGDGWLVGGVAAPGAAEAARLGVMTAACDGLGPGALNRLLAGGLPMGGLPAGGSALLSGTGGPVLALLRTDTADARFARRGVLVLANTDLRARHAADPSQLLSATGGALGRFAPLLPAEGEAFVPDHALALAPGEVRLYAAEAAVRPDALAPLDDRLAREAGAWGRLALENPSPAVDGGEFPVRRIAGELLTVEVDVVCDGHDTLAVALQWRGPDEVAHELRMRPLGNDRFQAAFPLPGLGRYRYRVEAWRDVYGSFRDELGKKHAAGVPIELEMIEGTRLVEAAAAGAEGALRETLQAALKAMEESPEARRTTLLSPGLGEAMAQADLRPGSVASERPVAVQAERLGARYASWYEVFPRSMSDDATRHGSFADVERHLPRVRGMGFDVLYFPPIHPIGRANRKGRNNTLTPGPEDVGSPYAIGSEEGGHDALHPELGTLEDFRHLVAAAQSHGIEIAIDFAVQCSPDHPWLKQHRGWFDWRPDGSIKYAENPPKKYQDIVNVDFYAPDAVPGLWLALCEVVLFWARQGVRLFRVDNPHTKPFPFWEWMIAEVQRRFPDAIFLAEAFTRPEGDVSPGQDGLLANPTPTSPGATPGASWRST